MNFKISIRKKNRIPILEIQGSITKDNLNKIKSRIESVQKSDSSIIMINLEHTDFIDSHGLGVFLFFWHKLAEEKRQLIFLKPQGFILDVLTETSLTKIFKIIESEEHL